MCSWTNSSVEETTLFILTALLSMDCMNKIDSLSASARKAALIHCSGVCLLNLWFAVRTAARRSLWEALNVLHIWQFWLTFFQSLIFPTALTETYLEVFPVFLLPFFPPLFFLGHVSRNKNRQLISTVCSVLKLLLSHSGHHGLVVSYWFSERPITFPHNGCHYLFSISLQLGFDLSWFLPIAVDAFLAVAPRLTVKSVKSSLSYCFKVFLFVCFFFVLFYLTMKHNSGDVDSLLWVL